MQKRLCFADLKVPVIFPRCLSGTLNVLQENTENGYRRKRHGDKDEKKQAVEQIFMGIV